MYWLDTILLNMPGSGTSGGGAIDGGSVERELPRLPPRLLLLPLKPLPAAPGGIGAVTGAAGGGTGVETTEAALGGGVTAEEAALLPKLAAVDPATSP